MDANDLMQRIAELDKEIEISAAHHNAKIGRKMELQELLEKMAQNYAEPAKVEDGEIIEAEPVVSE